VSQALVAGLCRDDDMLATFCTHLVQLLGDGQPVARARLAAAHGVPLADVDAVLKRLPYVEFDGHGNIIAAGLSLVPTSHQFQVNGRTLYTWCALDTLMYPVVLQQAARVSSRCPVSGREVRLTLTPEYIVDCDPVDALMSLVVPEAEAACCDVRGAFCRHVHFLGGPAAGVRWRATHPETVILSVAEAFDVARYLAACRYRPALP
jgi:alkylmercury lyase